MTRFLVVGDVVDDIVVRPLDAVNHASDTVSEIRRTNGGSGANVAAWMGHLGADVRFVGRAGTDGAERHARALSAYGVDARVSADPDLPTATLVATLDAAGERTMYVDRAANARLDVHDLHDGVLDGVGWLHLTGYSLFDDAVRPAVLDLAHRARALGCGLSVDPSSLGFLEACGASTFLGWAAEADLLFPNLDEGRFLTGATDPQRRRGDAGRALPGRRADPRRSRCVLRRHRRALHGRRPAGRRPRHHRRRRRVRCRLPGEVGRCAGCRGGARLRGGGGVPCGHPRRRASASRHRPWWDGVMNVNAEVLIVFLIGISIAVWLGVKMVRDR